MSRIILMYIFICKLLEKVFVFEVVVVFLSVWKKIELIIVILKDDLICCVVLNILLVLL